MPGTATSPVEVLEISRSGFRILVDGRELLVSFDEFPWFRAASAEAIRHVDRPHPHHLRWPDLDVDLTVESIENPERYPLKSCF